MDVANWTVDSVSHDHYRDPFRDLDEEELSFSASLTSAVPIYQPWWLMEHSTSAVNWQPVNPRKPRGQLISDSLTHVAHGADAVCYFHWRQSSSGAEKEVTTSVALDQRGITHIAPNTACNLYGIECHGLNSHQTCMRGLLCLF